ncbi:MAG: hypothetical protein RL764_104 [Pseudomonadota bacterium]|jgi:hypothetical protein
MKKQVWTTAIASALALSGCGSSDDATTSQSNAETSVDNSATESPNETIASEVSLPQISVSCNHQESGNEVLRMVSDPSTGAIYVHNVVDEVNENRYSQKATSYSIDGNKLIFFAQTAKVGKDDPDRVVYDLNSGDWSEETDYNPQKRKEAEACEAREQMERADCAEAANINACIAARYPGIKGMCYSGSVSFTINRSCTPLQDYGEALKAAKIAWQNSLDYWSQNQ